MKYATRRLLSAAAILAMSVVALVGSAGVAGAKTTGTPSSILQTPGNGNGSGSASVFHINFLGCVFVSNKSGTFPSCD